jgi:hypothetical protein
VSKYRARAAAVKAIPWASPASGGRG